MARINATRNNCSKSIAIALWEISKSNKLAIPWCTKEVILNRIIQSSYQWGLLLGHYSRKCSLLLAQVPSRLKHRLRLQSDKHFNPMSVLSLCGFKVPHQATSAFCPPVVVSLSPSIFKLELFDTGKVQSFWLSALSLCISRYLNAPVVNWSWWRTVDLPFHSHHWFFNLEAVWA